MLALKVTGQTDSKSRLISMKLTPGWEGALSSNRGTPEKVVPQGAGFMRDSLASSGCVRGSSLPREKKTKIAVLQL
jgi:hypothetical protein